MAWGIAVAIGLAVALLTYRGARYGLPVALRALAGTVLAALLLDAPFGPTRPLPPWVALDVSASWDPATDSAPWRSARAITDSLLAAGGDSLLLFGSEVRSGPAPDLPRDTASQLGALVEAARGAGRPVVVVTDGRLSDGDRLGELPRGSRAIVVEAMPREDVAIAGLDAPAAAVVGDSFDVRVVVRAGGMPAAARQLTLLHGAQRLALVPIAPLDPFAEREIAVRVVAAQGDSAASLVAALDVRDAVVTNDSASRALPLVGAATTVLISTSPDQDARFILSALRSTQRAGVQAYWQVATGQWREGDALRPVAEATVRRALADASLAVLHGDTAYFGPPRARTAGALVLVVPPDAPDEHYVTGIGDSPLGPMLASLPMDVLPPLRVGTSPRDGMRAVLLTQRARRTDGRAAVALQDVPTRVVVIPAGGFWRWKMRGGAAGDAFDALWGTIFDWATDVPRGHSVGRGVRVATELLPSAPSVRSGAVGTAPARDVTPRARGAWWLAVLAVAALCGEWLLRRRRGWR